jgi:GT2 family glycosyltransferase
LNDPGNKDNLEMTDLSIIIVNYNGSGFIEGCLSSIKKYFGQGMPLILYEAIVVDNSSTDTSGTYVKEFCSKNTGFRLIENTENIGFGRASNRGASEASGRFLLFLNPDCKIIEGNFGKVVSYYLSNDDAGALGVKIIGTDGRLQHSCRSFPSISRQFYESFFLHKIFAGSRVFGSYFMTWWDHKNCAQVDWLSGSFLMIKRKYFEEAGGFDSDYFMYSEDADLCLKLYRKGLRNYYYPFYTIQHEDAAVASVDMALRESQLWRARRLYFLKNYSKLHAILVSLLYFIGLVNRIAVFFLISVFNRDIKKQKRVPRYIRAVRLYFGGRSYK